MKKMNKADEILIATSPERKSETHPFDSLLTGFIAGIVSRTVTSPLDVVKMLLQTHGTKVTWRSTVANIWKKDGIRGFWRGNLVACACNGPLTAVKYCVIDDLTELIGKGQPMGIEARCFIGSVAGILSQSVCYPLDLILTRLTVHPDMYHNFFQATSKIIKEEGFFGLWHGLMPTVAGAIVYEGSQYVVSSGIKQFFAQRQSHISAMKYLLTGATAGVVSQTIAFPFDVMRRRMMLVDSSGKKMYSSYFNCFKTILHEEGALGFFRGVTVNLIKVIPCAALQYTINEELKECIQNFRIQYLPRYNKQRQNKK